MTQFTDKERLDWLEKFIADEAMGFELYPIGPNKVFAEDGNTVVDVDYYMLYDKYEVKTLRDAIDARMSQYRAADRETSDED